MCFADDKKRRQQQIEEIRYYRISNTEKGNMLLEIHAEKSIHFVIWDKCGNLFFRCPFFCDLLLALSANDVTAFTFLRSLFKYSCNMHFPSSRYDYICYRQLLLHPVQCALSEGPRVHTCLCENML